MAALAYLERQQHSTCTALLSLHYLLGFSPISSSLSYPRFPWHSHLPSLPFPCHSHLPYPPFPWRRARRLGAWRRCCLCGEGAAAWVSVAKQLLLDARRQDGTRRMGGATTAWCTVVARHMRGAAEHGGVPVQLARAGHYHA